MPLFASARSSRAPILLPLYLLCPPPPTPPVSTLSLHDALPIYHGAHDQLRRTGRRRRRRPFGEHRRDRRADRRSEEHTSELQSPYELVCRPLLEKKTRTRPARMTKTNRPAEVSCCTSCRREG